VRDVPPALLETITPCLEIARAPDEPPGGHAVVFRSTVLRRLGLARVWVRVRAGVRVRVRVS